MHRRLREFGQRYSLTEEKATLYGVFNDYRVSFQYNAFTNPQQTAYVAADTRAAYQQINAFLSTNQKRLHIVRFLCYAEGIAFSVLGMTGKKEVEYLESATRELTDFLKTQGVPTAEYCVYCGQKMEEKVLVNQDGSKFYAHEACFVQAHGSIVQAEQAYDAQPNHYGRGILGAFIGALIGCVVWAIVYLIGFVASIGLPDGVSCRQVLRPAGRQGKQGQDRRSFPGVAGRHCPDHVRNLSGSCRRAGSYRWVVSLGL